MAHSNIITTNADQFRVRSQIEETYRLVYFDAASGNERLSETLKCRLREIVNQTNTVKTISECENLINDKINDNMLLIINCPSPHIIEEIINSVSHYRHVVTIYIITHPHRETTDISKYSKVINIKIEDLVSHFANDQAYRQQYHLQGVAFRDRSTNFASEIFGILQFLDKVTRRVGWPTPDTPEQFLLAWRQHCAGNNAMLSKVDQFESEYTAEQALWWYTTEPFIYDTMNKALRTLNFPALQLFTFFIRDIHAQLSYLYQNSTQKDIIHLYRGQAMSRIEVNHLKSRIDEIISISSFLSTSRDRDIALGFALASIDGRSDIDELNAVLLEIEADPSLAIHTPFANISRKSKLSDEEEYLFHINSLFRVVTVEDDQYTENLIIIRLTLISLPPERDDVVQAARTLIYNHVDDIGRMVIDMTYSTSIFMSVNREIRAQKLLKNINNPDQLDKHANFIKNGDQAISNRQYSNAIDFYREALRINPSNAYTWVQIAKAFHNLANHEHAIFACYRAIDLHSMNNSFLSAYCHYLLAMSFSETSETKEALFELEETINIVNSIEMHDKRLISNEDRGSPRLDNLSHALDEYTISGKTPELLVSVYEQMAIAYEALPDSQKALIWFQKALNICRDVSKMARLEKQIERNKSNALQ